MMVGESQEEQDLVIAHQKLVEETIDIVREVSIFIIYTKVNENCIWELHSFVFTGDGSVG